MIRRLNKLYKKHAMQLNPEPQSEEMKMRKVLDLADRFQALEGKVRAIRERTTSPRVDPITVTHEHTCVDLGAQWLAWGEEETMKIKVTRVGVEDRVAAQEKRLAHLDKEIDAKIQIKVARAAASKGLGQGKPGGLQDPDVRDRHGRPDRRIGHCQCLGKTNLGAQCTGRVIAPPSVKEPALCKDCWQTFHTGTNEEHALANGRTMKKEPTAGRPRNVTMKCLRILARAKGLDVVAILRHHTHDFISLNQSVYFEDTSTSVKIAVTKMGGGPKGFVVFILLDACAGVGASDALEFFHGNATACNYGIAGVQAKDAPMSIGMSQGGAALMEDLMGQLFIVRYGGASRAEEGDLNETIFSVSQMLAAHVKSGGKQGGFMGGKSLAINFPRDHGVRAACSQRLSFRSKWTVLGKERPTLENFGCCLGFH
jgi:hypothetical protein